MISFRAQRTGFALAVTLAAIVVIGALVAGVLFATTQDYRSGGSTLLQTRAMTAAEYGLDRTLTASQWQTAWNGANPGLLATVADPPGDGSTDTVRVTSLGNAAFLVTSEGRAGTAAGAQARRRIGSLIVLNTPSMNFLGALTSRGAVKVGGSSFINGNDSSVSNWNCPPNGAGIAALTVPDTTQITTAGCGGYSCLAGPTKVAQDPGAGSDSTYFQYGSSDWNTLTAAAQKVIPAGSTINGIGPSLTGSTCNTSDPNNWGDPLRDPTYLPCDGYYPVIYAEGDLHVTGGEGQGILLVDGTLSVSGSFQFFGPVIVRGSLKTTGTGGHFTGGVMAANVDLEQNEVLGNAVIQYSQCVLAKSLSGASTPALANGHSWVELY